MNNTTDRLRDERGIAVKGLLIVVALVIVGVLAYEPGRAFYEETKRKWAVGAAADDGLAAVNAAIQNGTNPRRAASDLSTDTITVEAEESVEGSYCVRALWVGPARLAVEPAERGDCA